ncbi:tetratricopeptide repeat protein [Thermaerobacillus caldiproteolyticus]|uniref:tetratricopeptide repeat protein n=1 Tax=Thermaerobacillus caldiproteolyticus TaxID=247480 RepID=UPI00188C1594|nr:tetratricopeptide repeat protein [Anoxybacillus caldiproteolyticus]QPA32345.1 tetratricopeptide repeat protein [Anoxybacillus caldiproteolyticus]
MDIQIPFNMNYFFNDILREVPESTEQMELGVQYLIDQFEKSSGMHKARIVGLLGVYSRILSFYNDGEYYLKRAISLYEEHGNELSAFVNKIRLAHIFHWKKRFEEAVELFESLREQALINPKYSKYLDFIYQHYGKCLLDQGKCSGALVQFNMALALREKKGEEDLIVSTAKAIELCERLMRY